ncbi:response regulator [Vibrio sp. V38_P2S17PM301]|uniref:response regulator n=3 Tax=unclassified Vibrio TaxID=2614977 RepID=UPI001361B90B|nr:response regulator [Vibrio sp. V38_P2S17PM301]NAX25830.1 response regulator [Vibrio sp. V38_P2S17PM301]
MVFDKTSVYIFYNDAEMVDIIIPIFESMFNDISKINKNSEHSKFAKKLTEDHVSIIYVYVFEHAIDAYQLASLIREHHALKSHSKTPHFDILLCDKSSRQKAYTLCSENEFYIYEIVKPIYDANRLKLTIKRLAEHLMADVHLLEVIGDNASLLNSLSQSIDSISQCKNDVDHIIDVKNQEFKSLVSPLDNLLKHVPTSEWDKSFTNIIKSLPEHIKRDESFNFSLKSFRENLQIYKESSSDILQTFSSMLDEIRPKLNNKKKVIVVAEDQPVMQKIIMTILEPRGFKVELASNGVEALIKAKVMLPSVILLDIDMPIMDGLSTLQAIKKLDVIKDVPIIMLTSHADKEVIQSCIQHGASDYAVKPTTADLLLKKIAKAIS